MTVNPKSAIMRPRLIILGYEKPCCVVLESLLSQYALVGIVTETDAFTVREAARYAPRHGVGLHEDLAALARRYHLPVFQPENFNASTILAELTPSVLLCIGYHTILSPAALAVCPAINLHAGALPQYRGRNPIGRALSDRVSSISVTAHYMVPRVDSGAVLAEARIPIYYDDTELTVLARTLPLYSGVAHVALRQALDGKLGIPQ